MLAAFLLHAGPAFSRQQFETETSKLARVLGRPVHSVEVVTGATVTPRALENYRTVIGLTPGEPLALARVREAIIRLYESGRASAVSVEAVEAGTAVDVRFRITPQARIRTVTLSDLEEDLQADLIRRLPEIDPGTRISPGLLDRASEKIVEYLQMRGYFQSEVTHTTQLDSTLRLADITFKVNKGPESTIESIDLKGNLTLPREELLEQMSSKPDMTFDQARLQSDLDQIRDLYLKRNYLSPAVGAPDLESDAEHHRVRIKIRVESGPIVEVAVTGYSISSSRLRKILPIYRQGGIDSGTLEEGRLNLIEQIQRAGYFFAEVTVERSRPSEAGPLRIVYRVDPGQRLRLAKIQIQGTDEVTLNDLRNRLGSIPGSLFSRGITSHDLIRQDAQTIVAFLREKGYRNATVAQTKEALTLGGKDLVIIHVVETGPLSRLSSVKFEGIKEKREEELRAATELTIGDPFSESRMNDAAARLGRLYAKEGYDESEVNAQVEEISPEKVGIRFQIHEGPRIRIQRIFIRGEQKTRESAIRRFLSFRAGALLNRELLLQGEQDLLNTGAFRRVTIRKQENPLASDDVEEGRNVVVDVAESQKYQIGYGAGFRTEDGPRGLFEISNNNLLGRLYTGGIRLRASRREQIGQISISNPRPFGWPLPALISTYFQEQREVGFDARRLTAVIQVEKRLSPLSELALRYSFSNVRITNVTDPSSLQRQDETARIGQISVSFLRDERNAVFDATSGNYTALDFSVASSALIGDENYVRFFAEHQRFYPIRVLPSTVVAMDARLGLAHPFASSEVIPISERFFTGGSTTLRGFGFEEAGPRVPDPESPGQTKPAGGNAVVILNAELRFPIWERFRLGGALFYDTGNVFAGISDIAVNKFTHTVGFGLRVHTPVGPIRLDFGWLVRKEPLVPRSRTHITFGPPF